MTGPTYDTSTPAAAEPFTPGAPVQPPVAPQGGYVPQAGYAPPADDDADSLLDTLFEQVGQRDNAEDAEPWVYRIKDTRFRVVCDPDIEYSDFQRWMKSSRPQGKKARRTGGGDASDIDQVTLSALAIINQNLRIEVLKKDTVDDWYEWRHNGAPVTVDSPLLLQRFGVMDPVSALRRLFGRDGRLIDAGQDLLEKSGMMGEDDDESDPTPVALGARHGTRR